MEPLIQSPSASVPPIDSFNINSGAGNPIEAKILELVRSDITSTAKERSETKRKVALRRAIYNSQQPNPTYRGRSNVRVPFPYVTVQSMVPRYMNYTFSGTDVLKSYPRGHSADWGKARNAQYLINFQLMFEADFFMNAMNFYIALSRDGLAIQKIKWDAEIGSPVIYQIQGEDFCMDKSMSFINRQTKWAGHLVGKTRQDLIDGLSDPSKGYNPETVNEILKGEPDTTLPDGTSVPKSRGIYKIWEWWGICDLGNGPERCIINLVDGKDKILSYVKSPYGNILPFVALNDVDDPFHFSDGKSELDVMEPLYEMANSVWNQRLDNVTQGINGHFIVKKGSGLDLNRLTSTPWGVTLVNQPGDITKLETPNVTQNAYVEVREIIEAMKDSSGLTDMMRGAVQSGAGTATESTQIAQGAAMRPGLKQMKVAHQYVKRVGELFLAMDQMFMSTEKAIAVTGDRNAPASIAPNDIIGQYEMMPSNFRLVTDINGRIAQLSSMLNMAGNNLGKEIVAIKIWKEMCGLANIDISEEEWTMALQLATGQQAKQMEMQTYDGALGGPANKPTGPIGVPRVANTPSGPPQGASRPANQEVK